jgi:hypothetical protein
MQQRSIGEPCVGGHKACRQATDAISLTAPGQKSGFSVWCSAASALAAAVLAPSASAQTGSAMAMSSFGWVDTLLAVWFALTGLTVLYLAWDLFTRTPAMKVMKWGWLLVALYTGPVAFIVYWFSCREPVPSTHEQFVAPQWKQTVGSTIHCMAGHATGVIVAAVITSGLHAPMSVDSMIEYAAGFFFGLFIFQALFMKDILGGSYWSAVRATILPEWLSMNGVMAGMIPTMVILMTHDMTAMHPTSVRFWGVMSLATLIGAIPSYPINWWLVSKGLKHGMGTERVLGCGGSPSGKVPDIAGLPTQHEAAFHESGHNGTMNMEHQPGRQVSGGGKVIVSVLSLAILAFGILVGAVYGDFSMSAGQMTRSISLLDPIVTTDPNTSSSLAMSSSHQ